VDNDEKKIAALEKGRLPIYEPGLEELIKRNVKKKRLKFSSHIKEAVDKSQVIFIAVGTPSLENGEADLTGIENVARQIAKNLTGYRLVVEKSTVPVETGAWVKRTISTYLKHQVKFDVASNPEFLREGCAIYDFMHPDRIVIGVETKKAEDLLTALYKPLKAPILVTDIKSAELIKHAANSFLATKISFINAVAHICDLVGADIKEVASGIGLDKRIGANFLNAGIGYGGSCFPKDVEAFIKICKKLGYDFQLLEIVKRINEQQREFFLTKIKDNLWILKDKTIGVLGLSFKPDTDDIRNSPALEIIRALQEEGAAVKVYDPQAMPRAREVLKNITFAKNAYQACRNCDCLLFLTDWEEFKQIDWARVRKLLKRPLVIDGRNMFEAQELKRQGFTYVCIGRTNA
jgi:UDPglucose 6-dehydrogenase